MPSVIDSQDELQIELARLEAEFAEGDLTEKGYLKKKNELIKSFSRDLLIEDKRFSNPPIPEESTEITIIDSPVVDWGATNKSFNGSVASASPSSTSASDVEVCRREKKDYNTMFRKTLLTRTNKQSTSSSTMISSLNQPFLGAMLEKEYGSNTLVTYLRNQSHSAAKDIACSFYDAYGKEDSFVTFEKLNGRAEKISQLIKEKRMFKKGDPIVLMYLENEVGEFIAALYGVFYSGCSAIPFVANGREEAQDLASIINQSGSKLTLTSDAANKLLSKEIGKLNFPKIEVWKTNDLGSSLAKKKGLEEIISSNLGDLAYFDYEKSSFGELKGAMFLQSSIVHQACMLKQIQALSKDEILLSCLDGRVGLGLFFSSFLPVYVGLQCIVQTKYDSAFSFLKFISKSKGKNFLTFSHNTLLTSGSAGDFD